MAKIYMQKYKVFTETVTYCTCSIPCMNHRLASLSTQTNTLTRLNIGCQDISCLYSSNHDHHNYG